MKKVILFLTVLLVVSFSADAGFLHHWEMNEASGLSVSDSGTGNSNGAFMQNELPAVAGEGPTWINDTVRGTALVFDGNDWILTDSQGVLGGNARTVAMWFKLTEDKYRHTLIEWGNGNASQEYFRLLIEDNRLRMEVSGGNALALAKEGLVDNQWYHVAMVVDDFNSDGSTTTSEIKFYLDGNELSQSAGRNQVVNTTFIDDEYIRLGGGNSFSGVPQPREALIGNMDDVRVYDHALSSVEVLAIAVPEPSTIILLSLGGVAMRRKFKA